MSRRATHGAREGVKIAIAIFSFWSLAWFGGAAQAAQCHTALVLALDISDSVDAHEAELQRRGLAAALRDPAVRAAIAPSPTLGAALTTFEWNDPVGQRTLAPWSLLTSDASIDAFADQILNHSAQRVPGQTALGAAMRHAARQHAAAPPCERRIIDISGDGPGNSGVPPVRIKQSGLLNGITVNGLVIRNPEMDSAQPPSRDPLPYYQKNVRHGPGSFVMVIDSFDDYAKAMRDKLLRELSPSFAELK